MSVDVILTGDGVQVIAGVDGPQGVQGRPARQDLSPFFQGQLGALELLYRVTLSGDVDCDAAHSAIAALRGPTNAYTLSVCRNAAYANALSPTQGEIAAALWASGDFAANGQSGPQIGSVSYSSGGSAAAGDVLDFWAQATSDPTLTSVSMTLAGP